MQIEAERLGDFFIEDCLRSSERPIVNRRLADRLALELLLQFERIDPDERGRERRLDRVSAGKQSYLPALLGRSGREDHRAVTDHDQRRDAFGGFRDEHIPGRQSQLEVHGLDHQIPRRKLFLRVQREPMETFDDRQAFLTDDPPRLSLGRITWTPHVEPPGVDAPARARLREDIREQLIALAWQRAEQWRSVALVHDDARHALGDHRVEELDRRVTIGVWRQQLAPTSAVSGGNGCLDRLKEGLDRQIFVALAGCRLSSVDGRRAEENQAKQQDAVQLDRPYKDPDTPPRDSAAEPRQIRRQVKAHGLSDFEPTQHQHRQVVAEP